MNVKKAFLLFIIAVSVAIQISCKEDITLNMATTTSTDNTGLLDYLQKHILQDTGIELKWVAVGTGRALALGKNCDVDVLLVHAPAAEMEYVKDGYGKDRTQIMYNDFIIIGYDSDSAKIRGKSVEEALSSIKAKKALFVSRGDDSGTHKKEKSLWKSAGIPIPDKTSWYIESGQGMIQTINIASERKGYTLTDRGTYIKYMSKAGKNSGMKIMVEGDDNLKNQYSIIAVNPDKCKNAKYELTKKLISWFASEKTQKLIGDFRLLGKRLFIQNAH